VTVIVIDCLGQRCPLPVIALAKRIRGADVEAGAVIRVLADDPAAANDIPAWCRMKDQQYLGSPGDHAFEIRKIS
jgi:tRNA 2-thiouridine synthesizing protein A